MNKQIFDEQVRRLTDTYGERAYLFERQKLLWRAFGNEHDDVFIQAVDILLMSCRSTPMHKDFHDAIGEARKAVHAHKYQPLPTSNFAQALEAIPAPDAQSFEFKDACLKHLRSFLSGEVNKEQFLQGCDYLDQTAGLMKRR